MISEPMKSASMWAASHPALFLCFRRTRPRRRHFFCCLIELQFISCVRYTVATNRADYKGRGCFRVLPPQFNGMIESKKFWEELISYFPVIRHGPHRKRNNYVDTHRQQCDLIIYTRRCGDFYLAVA
jgi:hypothetical protein